MGIAADLSYVHHRPNVAQRTVQSLAATSPGAWFFARVLPPLDRSSERLSHGRVSLPLLLAGLPALVLTTTGRRTGQQRAAHLIAVPFAETLALLGTNFGQPRTPAWVLNLEADPMATVTHRGVTADVFARPASPSEAARILADSASVYAGYQRYQDRITGRTVRIFVLESRDPIDERDKPDLPD
jgi:deazaflavin-dependent oxidoreductase (nitroreductase family)